MAATHLLDTSIYSQRLRPHPHLVAIARWDALGDAGVVTSTVCEAEVLFGIAKKKSERLAQNFATKLRPRVSILPVDSAVAAAYAQLRADSESVGITTAPMDLLIAATAKANGLIVATLNIKHFDNIVGITAEDWSQPS